MISSDGINWSEKTAPAATWSGIVWAPEIARFVAVATSGTNRAMTSDADDLAAIDPTSDHAVAGGTAFTITCPNVVLPTNLSVTFGGFPATSVVRVDANTITGVTPSPAPAGTVDVVIVDSSDDTVALSLAGGFTFEEISIPSSGFVGLTW
jgi:hypothetical protein